MPREALSRTAVCQVLLLLTVGHMMPGCSLRAPTPTATPVPTASPTPMATLQPTLVPSPVPALAVGKGAVQGILFSSTGRGRVIPGTIFYLTAGRGETHTDPPQVIQGPQTDQGDIVGTSDMQGRFFLNNVSPGNYYLLVWAPYDWIIGQESATDLTPRLITVEADQRQDLGEVHLIWP